MQWAPTGEKVDGDRRGGEGRDGGNSVGVSDHYWRAILHWRAETRAKKRTRFVTAIELLVQAPTAHNGHRLMVLLSAHQPLSCKRAGQPVFDESKLPTKTTSGRLRAAGTTDGIANSEKQRIGYLATAKTICEACHAMARTARAGWWCQMPSNGTRIPMADQAGLIRAPAHRPAACSRDLILGRRCTQH